MFDVTPDEIKQLNDVDLRELVGRLCEAELKSHGLSSASVTWGGHQTAADGGLDVRVALPLDSSIEGFVPNRLTGFQVKTPDMPRAAIVAEMRPAGEIRPVIQELADEAGAYIIVSSHGSTADSTLQRRREALREALNGVVNADKLYTDFYDRTRLATWVRCHPGLVTWVKKKIGRALIGWRPYGPWSGESEDVDAEYLLDDKVRIHLGRHHSTSAQPIAQAIDELRDELAQPGKIVRLVGLSGVGKTRFVQALFDARLGSRPLAPSLAVYTNLSDNPDPQPSGLASDLIANRTRAILIVDNCPPDLHRRLSDLCSGQSSTVSVITIEYDVRDDQPEGTQVVTLDTSSSELIEKLVRRRYPRLSQVDARTITDASGGNARIAIALAESSLNSDTIAGLSNDELFQRLFRQRQDPSDALLLAAQACSLVYSFQGETLEGEGAELPRLASLAGQTVPEMYRYVSEMLRRDLMQQRGVWRAVLPHAIANKLAARALEDTSYELLEQELINSGTEHLILSFSRRLAFLHDHPRAVAIVERWLAPDGLLGDATVFNDLGRAMFQNVAPVLPEATLASLERVGSSHYDVATAVWCQHLSLLRSLAYDPLLFDRSAQLLIRTATKSIDEREGKEASDAFVSLFTICLSGTHATVEQRLGVIEPLLRSTEISEWRLGLAALDAMLEATHFSSSYQFEFGARSRDYGYEPRSQADVTAWYDATLALIDRLALTEGVLNAELRQLLARNFRGLWTSAHMHGELERLCRRFAAEGFCRDCWVACRETMHFDKARLSPEAASHLSILEANLRPSNLLDRVRAIVLSDRSGGLDLDEIEVEGDGSNATERLEAIARELGSAVAADEAAFTELLPDILRGGTRAWAFGAGLAGAATDPSAVWGILTGGLDRIDRDERDVQVLRGYLAELWSRDKELAKSLLESVLDQPILVVFLPALFTAVEIDEWGAAQLMHALTVARVPVRMYRNLAFGRAIDHLEGEILKDLLLLIADQIDGFDVALEILYMRLYSDRTRQREYAPSLLEAGRELLLRVTFDRDNQREDQRLASVVRACLTDDIGSIAAEVAGRLSQAICDRTITLYHYDDLLKALLDVQPDAALDALFAGNEREQQAVITAFEYLGDRRGNPVDVISSQALIAWCEKDRSRRYPLAASIITFSHHSAVSGTLDWSEQAKALFTNAPDQRSVLETFVDRFQPISWSGSLAALIEANARLLDSVEQHLPSGLMPFVSETKAQLAQVVALERQRETQRDRARDETFE